MIPNNSDVVGKIVVSDESGLERVFKLSTDGLL